MTNENVYWSYAMLHFSSTRSLARVRFLGGAEAV
jgi:hypothetical protein